MKKILLVLLLIMYINAEAQTQTYSTIKDSIGGGLIFSGQITFDDLNKEQSFTWLTSSAEAYHPNEKTLGYLKTYLPDYTMVVFMGTWCGDSQYLIPRLKKVLQLINYPDSKLVMYGVDRAKTTKSGEEKQYNITLVPTIILFKNGKEVGRVTESVRKSIEEDLALIISS